MTIDVNSLQEFSDAELLKIVNLAIAETTLYGQIRTVSNRTIQTASLDQLKKLKSDLENKIRGATSGRSTNYARRRRG